MAGIGRDNRELLERLHRTALGPIDAASAAPILGVDRARAARLLRQLAAGGWLSRVRRGLYSTVPLNAGNARTWRDDPWVVAAAAFAPCYVGGWSALEHWELTEQLFRAVLIGTAQRVRAKDVDLQGTAFSLRHVPKAHHFGLRTVWRGQVRIHVSDPSRTMIDVLDDPSIGGGARHIADALFEYWKSKHRNETDLSAYARRLGNGTVFKRLGFLLEALGVEAPALIKTCRRHVTSGLSKLDPSVHRRGRIVKRWNLWVNVDISPPSRA